MIRAVGLGGRRAFENFDGRLTYSHITHSSVIVSRSSYIILYRATCIRYNIILCGKTWWCTTLQYIYIRRSTYRGKIYVCIKHANLPRVAFSFFNIGRLSIKYFFVVSRSGDYVFAGKNICVALDSVLKVVVIMERRRRRLYIYILVCKIHTPRNRDLNVL